jgi:hypothetical protein
LFKDTENPSGIPELWPAEINFIDENDVVVEPRLKMSQEELESYLKLHEEEKEDWNKLHSAKYLKSIPQEIPLWAFRAILTIEGIHASVETLINNLPEPDKTVANIQWNYGNYIERSHPLINSLGSILGLNKNQIDNIFIEASKLK